MKQKSLFIYLIVVVLTITTFTACRKQSNLAQQNDSEAIENMKQWFEKTQITKEKVMLSAPFSSLPKMSKQRIFARIQKLGTILKWDDAKVSNYNGMEYIVVPADEQLKPFSEKSFEAKRSLIFYSDNAGVNHMTITELIGDKEKKLGDNVEDFTTIAFQNMFWEKSDPIKNLNASIIFYDEDYKLTSSFKISNGLWSKAKIEIQNVKHPALPDDTNQSRAGLDEDECETYYTIGYWYDLNTGEVVSWSVIDMQVICPNSGNGGGSYGDGGPTPDCVTENVVRAIDLDNTYESNETIGFDIYDIQDNTNLTAPKFKKAKNPKWICIKSLGGWTLVSYETGVIVLQQVGATPAQDRWEWESLTHSTIEKLGIVIGGAVEPSAGEGTSHVYSLYAGMELDFSIKFTASPISCSWLPVLPPWTRNYHSESTFWDSKPY